MAVRKQYFGIKYPFTNDDIEKYEFDLNNDDVSRVTSELLHLIFTPKGQRLRHPDFGTDLVRYIFEPNDEDTWGGVKREIIDTVSRWIDGVSVDDVNVMASEDGMEIYVRVDYSVTVGNYVYSRNVVVEM